MSTYYHFATGEVREIEDAVHAEWQAEDNPKADTWLLQPTPPSYNPATHHAPEWVGLDWLVAEKTAEDLAAEARKIWENPAAFLAEFSVTEAESLAISTHPTVARLRQRLYTWVGRVFSDDPHVAGGLSLLVALGILTSERRAEILTKTTP